MSITRRQINLLRKAQQSILDAPKQFFMNGVYDSNEDQKRREEMYGYTNGDLPAAGKIPNCGTAACIAGWIGVHAMGKRGANPAKANKFYYGEDNDYVDDVVDLANDLLGTLNCRLFSISGWDADLRDQYNDATDKHQWSRRAKIAAKMIDRYIESRKNDEEEEDIY